MRFHFRASIKPIFENHVLSAVSGPFHPLYETKISNRSLSVVYGSITLNFFRGLWELVRTSGSTAETEFKKSVFWDTLLSIRLSPAHWLLQERNAQLSIANYSIILTNSKTNINSNIGTNMHTNVSTNKIPSGD